MALLRQCKSLTKDGTESVSCPSCNSYRIAYIGKIPRMSICAGNILPISFLTSGHLLKCLKCNLQFRWPRFNKDLLRRIYQVGNPENWQYEFKNRKDWQMAAEWVSEKVAVGSILDIGCWDGKFLESLKNGLGLYGVEINSYATEKATSKGIKIVARDIHELNNPAMEFDVITAFDFIEHVEDPFKFISLISRLTGENGYIIISSGNAEAITRKICGSKYWYCTLPEHISFINKYWCDFVAKKLNLEIAHAEKFSHAGGITFKTVVSDLIKNLTYIFCPSLFCVLRKIRRIYFNNGSNSNNIYEHPPSWLSAKDHLVVIFKKK
ncbi:MAG: class I SAM-dependent methyltransferase [Candidatus Omnitrophica bacterium]|nr:class I SAM-dependent methyltransferase [Candidatus Omnitrophota bacterium]